MTFPFTCSACGHMNHFEWAQVGRMITCGGCGKPMTVPVPMETAGPPDPPDRVFRFSCPSCGRKFSTRAELSGKKIRCTGCGAGVRVPQGEGGSVTRPSGSANRAAVGGNEPGPASPPARDRAARGDASFRDDEGASDSLAIFESVDSSRARAMEQVRRQVGIDESAPTPRNAAKSNKKKKKRKKKGSSYFDPKETLTLVAGVGALVAVLAGLAWGFPDFRFPLGGFLCVVGFIVYLMGAVALRQLVADEGVFKMLMYRFFPPYQLWYIATNWTDTKNFAAFFVAGVLAMSLGGAIIKLSPTGQKAEASERAYQKLQRGSDAGAAPAAISEANDEEDD